MHSFAWWKVVSGEKALGDRGGVWKVLVGGEGVDLGMEGRATVQSLLRRS